MNRKHYAFVLGSTLGISLWSPLSHAQAATILPGDPNPDAGISYEWTAQVDDNDTVNFTGFVGAKSWNEPENPIGLKGWTHTSSWIALELLQPAQLTIKLGRQAGIPTGIEGVGIAGNSLYPAFSLFSNWQNSGEEDHQFNTTGNTAWADEISYLAHEANQSAASTVVRSFSLQPGLYSLLLGANPPDPTLTGFHGYTATLTTTSTSATSVPEPSATAMLLVIGTVLVPLTRRKKPS